MHIQINDAIALTELRPTGHQSVLRHLSDPAIAATATGIPYPFGPFDFAEWMAASEAAKSAHGYPTHLAIRQSNDWLIGMIVFREILDGGAFEIGYWLAKPWWGRGIMTDAVGAACHHAAFDLFVGVLFANCFASNLASQRVLEKNGFVNEGKSQLVKDGERLESLVYVKELTPF